MGYTQKDMGPVEVLWDEMWYPQEGHETSGTVKVLDLWDRDGIPPPPPPGCEQTENITSRRTSYPSSN